MSRPQDHVDRIKDLLLRKAKGENIGKDDQILLDEWINRSPDNKLFAQKIESVEALAPDIALADSIDTNAIWAKIQAHKHPAYVVTWLKYAAAIILIVGCATIFWTTSGRQSKSDDKRLLIHDLPPGTSKATLTLSDGSVIDLDNTGNGKIMDTAGVDVVKSGSEIIYANTEAKQHSPLTYNIMQTPRGGQYSLVLPDGSKIWLNAASSVRFPVTFASNERTIQVAGEAYLEIAKDVKRPFTVQTDSLEITVLGTSFNINAYTDDDHIRTTLVNGSVKISASHDPDSFKPAILSAGEQLAYNRRNLTHKLSTVTDISQVVAWKNGKFSFNGTIRQILNEVARWYNIDLKYVGNIPTKELEGGFSRTVDLSKTLEILEVAAGVEFELKDRLLIIKEKQK